MSFEINIENGISIYTADELLGYSRSGMLYCGDVCLSIVIDKIVEYYEKREDNLLSDDEYHRGRNDGYDEAVSEIRGFIQSM